MSTILDTDREFAQRLPRQLIVPASAGSGKTTELTRQLIQLLLSNVIPCSDFNNILAITFTNNAALDMKRRVLKTLKDVHFGVSEEEETLSAMLPDTAEGLRADAGMLVERLLERYSDFHVQTIDSFLARVFKASSLEFGFSPDFAIRLSSDPLIEEAFEAVTRRIGENAGMIPLFGELVDLVLETGRSDGRFIWNPYEELSREVKLLYRRLVQHAAAVRLEDLTEEIRSTSDELIGGVLELDRHIDASAVQRKSLFEKYAHEARQGRVERLLTLKFPDPPITKTGTTPADFDRWVEEAGPLSKRITELRSGLLALRARQHFQPYARALTALQEAIETARRERGEVDIGEVSRRLAGFLASDVVPELYYKLGEEIRHFLIDEFQDTSPVQWRVLRPLIENALSLGGSLFIVGDLKQSIYSFRGADWRIMHGLLTSNPFPMAGPPDIRPLPTNYRSGERIVQFNREVFHTIVPTLITSGAERVSGLSTYQQDAAPSLVKKGYVETVFLERDDDKAPERAAIEEILEDCLRRGYHQRDIAILTPTNDAVIAVSEWLNKIPREFISHSSLDIRSRKVTAEIIALLRFLDSPVDDLSFASVLLGDILAGYLVHTGRETSLGPLRAFLRQTLLGQGSSRPLYTLFRDRFPEIWEAAFDEVFARVGYLPLYDLVSDLCTSLQIFDVVPEEEATVVKLLEVAQEFEETGTPTVRDFLQYCDDESEDADWTMALPADADAVQIMTVHKAKGLGFKVVIALLYDSRPRTDPVALIETEDGVALVRLTKDAEDAEELVEQYRRKQQDEEVDRLNKLYVALTRAEEELYVISVKRDKAGQPSEFLPSSGYERRTRRPKARPGTPSVSTPVALLHLRERKREKPTGFSKIGKAETARGDFLHAVLARITAIEGDCAAQVRQGLAHVAVLSRETLPSGLIGSADRTEEGLVRFLEHPEVRPFFEARPGRRVLNEQEFSDRSGRLLRMDKVIVDQDTVSVIDFKTGGESDAYAQQLSQYMGILRQVFPGKAVQGFVAYIDRLLVTEIAESEAQEP